MEFFKSIKRNVNYVRNRFANGLVAGTAGLIYDGVNNVRNEVKEVANDIVGDIRMSTSKRYDLGENGVKVPVGAQATGYINGKRVYIPGPGFKMETVKEARVYNGRDGKIDWSNPENAALLGKPEIVQAIMKQNPESFKTLPKEAFAMDPIAYGEAFAEGVKSGYNPAKHGSKADYFKSMTDMFSEKQQELSDYRKEQAAERAAAQQKAAEDQKEAENFDNVIENFTNEEENQMS